MANAVLDGVDGILLGAETLRGRHPVATVDTILHICKQAEKVFDHHHHFDRLMQVAPLPAPLPSAQPLHCSCTVKSTSWAASMPPAPAYLQTCEMPSWHQPRSAWPSMPSPRYLMIN